MGLQKKGFTVFVVDDEVMIRRMIEYRLKDRSDLSVFSFASGEECLEQLEKKTPDIVMLDYHMSNDTDQVMNGLEVLQKIKEIEPETNVAMLSSQDNVKVAVNVLKEGAVDYIIKNALFAVNAESTIDKIIQNLNLNTEILALSETIKRDKIMLKGYSLIVLLLCLLAYYFFVT